MTPQGNNTLNFGLARDQVVQLETAANFCTGRPGVKSQLGRFSLEVAFIIQEKEFIVAKTYHAD